MGEGGVKNQEKNADVVYGWSHIVNIDYYVIFVIVF